MVPAIDEILRQRGVEAGLSQKMALATSLMAMVPTSAMAGWRQYQVGHVITRALPAMIPGAVAGAVAGAIFGKALQADALRAIFATALIFVGVKMVLNKKKSKMKLKLRTLVPWLSACSASSPVCSAR